MASRNKWKGLMHSVAGQLSQLAFAGGFRNDIRLGKPVQHGLPELGCLLLRLLQ